MLFIAQLKSRSNNKKTCFVIARAHAEFKRAIVINMYDRRNFTHTHTRLAKNPSLTDKMALTRAH